MLWKGDTLFDKEQVPILESEYQIAIIVELQDQHFGWKCDTLCDKEHNPILQCEYQIAMIVMKRWYSIW